MPVTLTELATPGPTKDAFLMILNSEDAAATVEGASYFDAAAGILAPIGLIMHVDANAGVLNLYGYTNDGTDVTLMTGAVSVTGPGVEFT